MGNQTGVKIWEHMLIPVNFVHFLNLFVLEMRKGAERFRAILYESEKCYIFSDYS